MGQPRDCDWRTRGPRPLTILAQQEPSTEEDCRRSQEGFIQVGQDAWAAVEKFFVAIRLQRVLRQRVERVGRQTLHRNSGRTSPSPDFSGRIAHATCATRFCGRRATLVVVKVSPIQGFRICATNDAPRALPWADLFNAYGVVGGGLDKFHPIVVGVEPQRSVASFAPIASRIAPPECLIAAFLRPVR